MGVQHLPRQLNEAPSTNIQHPEKHQNPNIKPRRFVQLGLGDWNFFGAWMLEFGICDPVPCLRYRE